jgi:hypothetical protein
MNKEDKVKIDKEVFEIIEGKMRLMAVPFSMDMFKFGLEIFLEGVNFIPRKCYFKEKK